MVIRCARVTKGPLSARTTSALRLPLSKANVSAPHSCCYLRCRTSVSFQLRRKAALPSGWPMHSQMHC